MPELPEVETVRRGLQRLVGLTVTATSDMGAGRVRGIEQLEGQRIAGISRRGKLLIAEAERHVMLAHLGMTGQLTIDIPAAPKHVRATITLQGKASEHTLTFVDPRRFGHLTTLKRGEEQRFPLLARMGPEPHDLDGPGLLERLSGRRGSVKGALLDQSVIAGVGNIYADEALWGARIDPARPAGSLDTEHATRLILEIRQRMDRATAAGGTTLNDHRQVDGTYGSYQHQLDTYGRSGSPCGRCGTLLLRTRIAGRGTTYCPSCQQ